MNLNAFYLYNYKVSISYKICYTTVKVVSISYKICYQLTGLIFNKCLEMIQASKFPIKKYSHLMLEGYLTYEIEQKFSNLYM